MEGVQLEQHYRDTLKALGEQGGMLGLTFRKAQTRFRIQPNYEGWSST